MKTSLLVEKILQTDAWSRDSDKRLILEVLRSLGADLDIAQEDIIMSVSFESIRRTRQKLNEQGKYLGSEAVRKERKMKSYEVQQSIKNTSDVAELIERKPVWRMTIVDGEQMVVIDE